MNPRPDTSSGAAGVAPGAGDALRRAEDAHALVQSAPRSAEAAASAALAAARRSRDRPAAAAALHALGFARLELGRPDAAATLARAVRTAERSGATRRAGLARRTLAVALAGRGRVGAARREIERACEELDGLDAAHAEAIRLGVITLAGDAAAPLDRAAAALRTLRRAGDGLWQARLLYNRGVLHAERGDAPAALADLAAARGLYAELGADVAVADVDAGLAHLLLLRGDVPGSLAALDRIALDGLPATTVAEIELTRARALVAARLLPEAAAALRRATATWERAGARNVVARHRLDAARIALLSGDPAAARALAVRAGRGFAASGQGAWAAQAACLAATAALAGAGRADAAVVLRAAADLRAAAWRTEALRAELLAGRVAVARGAPYAGRAALRRTAGLARRGAVADRVERWQLAADVRLAEGDRRGAARALRAGLRLVDAHRAALGATELRATASQLGGALARSGVALALADRDARGVLDWVERWRANALRLPPVRPPDDAGVAALLAELRRVAAAAEAHDEGPVATARLHARQRELERAIRDALRHAAGPGADPTAGAALRGLARRLGDVTLVEYLEVDGALHAVVLDRGRHVLHALGPAAEPLRELRLLGAALRRLARGGAPAAATAAALASCAASAAALDAALVAPLRLRTDAALAIVPAGPLHALPWAALPSLRGRAVTVAPSAGAWLRAARAQAPVGGGAVLVAGPGLDFAEAEVRDVARRYAEPRILSGPAATAQAAATALDGAALGHVACHGRFRADAPLFSALALADGPLTASDLERLRRAPDVLVLSACDLALSATHPGDELVGVTAALLALGTRAVVASVVPVPDEAARALMLAFHDRLAAGETVAAALAAAQAGATAEAALAGFVCLGAGHDVTVL